MGSIGATASKAVNARGIDVGVAMANSIKINDTTVEVTEQLIDEIDYAKTYNQETLLVKDGKYKAGTWDDLPHAESLGWKYIGTAAQAYHALKKLNK